MICSLLLIGVVSFVTGQNWDYCNPSSWSGTCSSGRAQSPVNIDIAQVQFRNFGNIEFHDYDVRGTVDATNNGHTELVQGFQSWTQRPYITGGGLTARYYLNQFHFHWDGTDSRGSEHTIDGLHYPLELHFVHLREGLNETSAGDVPSGIAVIAVFFEVDRDGNAIFSLDSALAGTVPTSNEQNVTWYSPQSLLPFDTSSFFRYEGSLTTPPCSEGVVWSILTEPNYVTEEQLSLLRNHLTSSGSLLIDNWRPVQPLDGRTVYMNKKNKKHTNVSKSTFSLHFLIIVTILGAVLHTI